MGPQLYRCGNSSSVSSAIGFLASLQWGRNFIVAEIQVQTDINDISQLLLQWGRNFIVAEIRALDRPRGRRRLRFNGAATLSLRKSKYEDTPDPWAVPLQWGRNFIVAEIRITLVFPVQPIARFNGAATLSLRKYRSVQRGDTLSNLLQWGRNFIVAEIYLHFSNHDGGDKASMGPQLYRCGNVTVGDDDLDRKLELQWGRNFIVAEI